MWWTLQSNLWIQAAQIVYNYFVSLLLILCLVLAVRQPIYLLYLFVLDKCKTAIIKDSQLFLAF